MASMTKKFDGLNETFNTNDDLLHPEVVEKKVEKIKNTVDDVKKDYDYTRGNLYSIIEKGQEAINGILELAQESEMPRAYEVAGQLIKMFGDQAKDMMDLQGKKKKIDEVSGKPAATQIGHQTNVLFNGSTSELMKALKEDDAPIIEGEIDGSSD